MEFPDRFNCRGSVSYRQLIIGALTLDAQEAQVAGADLFPFASREPVLPFAHFANDDVGDVYEDDGETQAERPVQSVRLGSAAQHGHRFHRLAGFLLLAR